MRSITEAVIQSVIGRRPVDDRESASRDFIIEALNCLERPFDRRADPMHVTGSAVIAGPRGVLLHRHKRLGLWLQPGGHLDLHESPWEAAMREAEEETGLAFEPWLSPPPLLHMDVHRAGDEHIHLDLRYALRPCGGEEPAPGPDESPEVRWFPWPDAIAIADPGLRGLLVAVRPDRAF